MKGFRNGLAEMVLLSLVTAPGVVHAAPIAAEQAALRTAYLDLIQGDHDYKGHRIKALRQVEAAGKSIGLNVSGDGDARQSQARSDGVLRDAQNQLQAVRSAAAANGQGDLLKHCDEAIKQIQTALSIK